MQHKDYQKCAACILWFGNRFIMAERKGPVFHGYYGVVGGKVEKNETIEEGLEREIREETGLSLFDITSDGELVDCFMVPEHQHKIFLFHVFAHVENFSMVKNMEPTKHSDWKLYTVEEALELKLVPFIKEYLLNPQLYDKRPHL